VKLAIIAALLAAGCVVSEDVGSLPAVDGGVDVAEADAEVALACTEKLPCFAPIGDRVSICGQLHDVATDAPLRAAEATGRMCDPRNPSADGPCSVCANVFETAVLVADPTGASELDSASIEIDDCGRYRIVGAVLPDDGSLAVLTGNCAMPHDWTPTIATVSANLGERVLDEPIYAAARATVRAWTESANAALEPGVSFDDVGAYLVTFLRGDDPASGVTVTVDGRPISAAFYFSDTAGAPGLHEIDPDLFSTGGSGAALAIGTDFVLHGGSGGEPQGCVWPGVLAASVPGALFVDRKRARRTRSAGDGC